MIPPLKVNGKENPFQRSAQNTDLLKAAEEKKLQQENEEAKQQVEKYMARMGRVIKEVEDVLVKNEVNWREWGAIIKAFNDRNILYFDKVTLSSIIKQQYAERQATPGAASGGENQQPTAGSVGSGQ